METTQAILCIDDEELILESLSMEIHAAFPSLQVELLSDPLETEELIETLLEENIEIVAVICDYIMPGRKGDDVLIAIHARLPKTRTIMLTGQSSLEGVTNAINDANLYRYLGKPWGKEDLQLTLQAAMESYAQEERIFQQNAELKELNESLEQKVEERTAKLQEANRQIREYLDIINRHVIISRIDKQGDVIYASEAFCNISGFDKVELIGKNYWHTLYSNLKEADIQQIISTVQHGKIWSGEICHQTKDGRNYWVHEIITPNMKSESVVLGFTTIRQDITDKKKIEELSITDPLTGLYNRRYFDSFLERETKRAKRSQEWLVFMIMDVDDFKAYNDHYGHPAGDMVLQRLGNLLGNLFTRGHDYIFRIGGEEFALITTIPHPEGAEHLGEILTDELSKQKIRHEYSGPTGCITLSVGILLLDPSKESLPAGEIYHKADLLLYRAKQKGKNCFVLHQGIEDLKE